MARNVDVFGFDELEKAFKRVHKRYPNEADALLMAQGQQTNKRVKALTPVYKGKISANSKIKPGQLKKSWRLKKVKLYKGGTVRVVRIQSTAPHAHLVEQGHQIVTTRRTRDERGRYQKKLIKTGKTSRYNAIQKAIRGIKTSGRVEGTHMLEKSMSEARARFEKDAQKMLDKLTKDIQV